MTMLQIWLLELYLGELNHLEAHGEIVEFSKSFAELQYFLSEQLLGERNIYPLIYDLFFSHGRLDIFIFFASLARDFESVVRHYITHGQYVEALQVLLKAKDEELFYQHSTALLINQPKKTIRAWIETDQLNPRRLLPALTQYAAAFPDLPWGEHCGLKYLEYCVRELRVTDASVHDYLLFLLVGTNADEKLLHFLKESGHYDQQQALRLCKKKHKHHACIYLYNHLNMHEEALNLALAIDIDLAIHSASLPVDNKELSRALWLRIAEHLIKEGEWPKRVLRLLEGSSPLVLEDLIPLFPDSCNIDPFKELICRSMRQSQQRIDALKKSMEEAAESAQLLKKDLHELKNKYKVLKTEDLCVLCRQLLIIRQFFLFSCGHYFHVDCLAKKYTNHLTEAQMQHVEILLARLTVRNLGPRGEEMNGGAIFPEKSIHRLKEDICGLIAQSCLLCGELAVQSIDEPLIPPQDLPDLIKKWGL
ncbi:vacuolar protein sorting-associated protein 18 homolog [Zophobas morio]|uniref:vacuolar protein sorting-associated protein 18 homolog n=1 Tax=Zophobas morio TaxID=2755281 RepID=UPI0030835ACA